MSPVLLPVLVPVLLPVHVPVLVIMGTNENLRRGCLRPSCELDQTLNKCAFWTIADTVVIVMVIVMVTTTMTMTMIVTWTDEDDR